MACSALTREAFGGLSIACRAQELLERVAVRIDRAVEVPPRSFDLDGGFIHAPGVIRSFEVRPAAFVELWSILLHPAVDRAVIEPRVPVRASVPLDRGSGAA